MGEMQDQTQLAAVASAWVMPPREATQAILDRRSAVAGRYRASATETLADLLERQALERPEQHLLRTDSRNWTYREVNARADAVAAAAQSLGVKAGTVVALAMDNRPEFFFVWFGLAKLGAVVAFLNTHIGGVALAHALTTTGSQHAVVGVERQSAFDAPEVQGLVQPWLWPDSDGAESDTAGSAVGEGPAWTLYHRSLAEAPRAFGPSDRAPVRAGDTAIQIFTSGTTGLPKAALISHGRWLMTGEVMRETLGFKAQDCFYAFLPLYHGAASMSAASTAMAGGGSVALRRRFSRREFWADVRRHRVTVCQYVGEICRYLLASEPGANDADHTLRTMVGAGLGIDTWQRWVERFGQMRIFEGWGATEANTNTLNVDNRMGSCGRVPFWEKTNLRLVRWDVERGCHMRDEQGQLQLCRPGEVGEAIGRIHNYPDIIAGRFEGYTSKPATEQKILRNVFEPGDAWWSSGDLLRFDEDGYCYFVDRIGDTFRWKSENVSTMEVADAYSEWPGLEAITVYGVQVEGHEGRAGMAAVVMCAGAGFEPQAFYEWGQRRLPRYAQPLFVRVRDEADMTTTYKLRKVDLQREGYDANRITDPLFVRDDALGCYVPFSAEALGRALSR